MPHPPATALPSAGEPSTDDDLQAVLPEGVGRGTERRILAATARLVARRGTYGASIRDIAAAVGIRSSGLYEHFPSKDHIVATLVELGQRTQLATVVDAVAEVPGDPVGQVRRIVANLVTLACRFPDVAVVSVDALATLPPALAEPSVAIRGDIHTRLVAILEQGRADGTFDVADPGVAIAAVGSLLARVPQWFTASGALGVDDLAAAYAEFALRILGAAGPEGGAGSGAGTTRRRR